MGLYNGAVITSAGQNLLAQAISGTELTWTVMRASSVAIPEGTDLATLTALTGIEQTAVITDSSVYGSNVVQVSARFSNTGIDTAYLMETIGIYGQVTGGSETLIAVMTAETPDEMPVYDQDSPSAFIFNVQMSVQNANTITMVVNDSGTATVADLNRKVDLNGGDLSDTVVDTLTDAAAEYPVPAAGDTMKVIGGKIVKFCADIVKTFTGASSNAAGKKGLVPAPAAGRNTYYLRGDGTWQAPVNDNTTTTAGKALDARQANPNVSGSLGAQIKSLNDSIVVTELVIDNPSKFSANTGTVLESSRVIVVYTSKLVLVNYYIRLENPNGRPTIFVSNFPTFNKGFVGGGDPCMIRYSDNSMSITDSSLATYTAGSGVLRIGMYNFVGPVLSGTGNMSLSGTVIGKIG